METMAMLAEELCCGSDGDSTVQAWQTEQLQRLGLPRPLAEIFAGLVDWHRVADLVERGCALQLALEIVR
jgi:hypothetical protein